MSDQGFIDLYYADECRVSLDPVVPYAWQFKDEDVWMPTSQGAGLNCFGLIRRDSTLLFKTSTQSLTGDFIVERLEHLSLHLSKETVVVFDNARIHTAKAVQERRSVWKQRGLTLFYLPPYSPHLNLAEILWRKLKYEWLRPQDYLCFERLRYAVRLALAAVGSLLNISFSKPNYGFG
jgi:transposase